MSVYKNLRIKTASSIAPIDTVDNFLWNKVFRQPSVELFHIEAIPVLLKDTGHLNISIEKPENFYFSFNIKKIKVFKSKAEHYRINSKTNRVFFALKTPGIKNYKRDIIPEAEIKYRASLIEFDDGLYFEVNDKKNKSLKLSVNNTNYNFLINKSVDLISGNLFNEGEWNNKISEDELISEEFNSSKTLAFKYKFLTPTIKDYLADLKPKIYRINLLDLKSFEASEINSEQISLEVELLDNPDKFINDSTVIKKFELGKVKILNDSNKLIKKSKTADYKKLQLPLTPIKNFSFDLAENKILKHPSEFKDGKNDLTNTFECENYPELQPIINISAEEKDKLYYPLKQAQAKAADFLTENKIGLLSSKPGSGKSLITITALKYLIRKREIRRALILTDDLFIGEEGIKEFSRTTSGWVSVIKEYAEELEFEIINKQENKSKINKNSKVLITDFNSIFQYAKSQGDIKDEFSTIDCIVFDEVELITKNKAKIEFLKSKFKAEYYWHISSCSSNDYLKTLIQSELTSFSFNVGDENFAESVKQDFWTELKDDQIEAYDNRFSAAQKELSEIYNLGNPFQLQAKIFNNLHQLNQIANFTPEVKETEKLNLLLKHLKMIKSTNKKVMIISQYDKNGLEIIGEILDNQNLKFIKIAANITDDQIKNINKKLFKNNDSIIFLVDSHIKPGAISKFNIDYVINFDQWWIPQTQWKLEDALSNRKSENKSIIVFNYFTKNTVDERMQRFLLNKGLLDKRIVETVSQDKFKNLLDEEDWLEIFDISDIARIKNDVMNYKNFINKLKKLTIFEVIEMIKKLLQQLGYVNIKVMKNKNEDKSLIIEGNYSNKNVNFTIGGIFKLALNGLNEENIKSIIKTVKQNEYSKIFFITTASLNNNINVKTLEQKENIIIIDGENLAVYLSLFDLIS